MRSPDGLARRVLTAAALLAAFLGTLFLLDARVFALLLAVVLGVAAREWAQLAGVGRPGATAAGIGFALAFTVLALSASAAGDWRDWALVGAGAFWIVLAPAWMAAGIGRAPRGVVLVLGAGLLAAAGLAAVTLSPLMLFLVLGLVWIADTAAYFAGNAFGRRRLAPAISPGKTWEGVGGGLAATLVYAIIFGLPGAPLHAHAARAGWAGYLGAILLLCAVSVVGDLFESALKRRAGVKDSGSILPGHGGVLDRLDSMLSTLPVAAALLHWTSSA